MLRRWHKLLAPFFAVFLMLLALTGIAIQVTDMLDHGQVFTKTIGAAHAKGEPSSSPKRTAMREWNHWLKQLHSGRIVGLPGAALDILSAAALAYFAGSGLWMYLQPWLRWRQRRL